MAATVADLEQKITDLTSAIGAEESRIVSIINTLKNSASANDLTQPIAELQGLVDRVNAFQAPASS